VFAVVLKLSISSTPLKMEIKIGNPGDLPADSIVSIKFGRTRLQAPLETLRNHSLKFPDSKDESLLVDIFQPVASARLVFQRTEKTYRMPLHGNNDMNIVLHVERQGNSCVDQVPIEVEADAVIPAVPAHTENRNAAANAQKYLEDHEVLKYVQNLLHAIIIEKPQNPYDYMLTQLTASGRTCKGMGTHEEGRVMQRSTLQSLACTGNAV